VLDLQIGELVGLRMKRVPLRFLAAFSPAFATAAGMIQPLFWTLLCCWVTDLIALALPPLTLLLLPLGIAVVVMGFRLWWYTLSGTADLLEQAAAPAEAMSTRSARFWGLWLGIAVLIPVVFVGIVVGARTSNPFERRLVRWCVELASLPVGVLVTWLFTLRPLALASRTLRGPVGGWPGNRFVAEPAYGPGTIPAGRVAFGRPSGSWWFVLLAVPLFFASLLVWFFLPATAIGPETEAVAWLRVRPATVEAFVGRDDDDAFRQQQLQVITSREVLESALRRDGISELDAIRTQADPVAWLGSKIQVVAPPDCEVIRVGLRLRRGKDSTEAARIVNAITHAYLESRAEAGLEGGEEYGMVPSRVVLIEAAQ
jgi:hypothetical protein